MNFDILSEQKHIHCQSQSRKVIIRAKAQSNLFEFGQVNGRIQKIYEKKSLNAP